MGWIFLGYVWGFKSDSFTCVMASKSLLGGWMSRLKFCVFFSFYFRTVGFYLGRGVTWVVGFNGCGLPSLVCFSGVTLRFFCFVFVLFLFFFCFFRTLPMFWWYLGTCSGQKELT